MLRLVFLLQALIYLIIMPILHGSMEFGYRAPIFVSFVAVTALLGGFAAAQYAQASNSVAQGGHAATGGVGQLVPRDFVFLGFVVLAALYAYVSWSNGLLNRRQGSELMAEIYGNLPLVQLLVLRTYELAFVPIAVIFFFSRSSAVARAIVALTMVASLPFMGIEDSRGRLLVTAISIVSFVNMRNFIVYFYRYLQYYLLVGASGIVFLYISSQRSSNYARFEDYLFVEIVRRLDGLTLVTDLKDYGYLSWFGSFDLRMFNPFISKIPFLEAGRIAKIEGITSTKQYFLKTLLNTPKIDDSNSMITDPYYFAGYIGVALAFVLLGWFIAKFDSFIAQGRLFATRLGLAAALAFVTSFAMIEVDLFAAVITFVQNLAITFGLVTLIMQRPKSVTQHHTTPLPAGG